MDKNLIELRRKAVFDINSEIKQLRSYETRDTETISRVAKTHEKNYIERLQNNLERYKNKIEELEERAKRIERGEIDSEILTIAPEKPVREVKERLYPIKRRNRYEEFVKPEPNQKYIKPYEKFISIGNSLSEKLRSRLQNTPCNKGFLFKGIYFFGSLPDDGKDRSVSELWGSKKIIYEWNDYEVRKYEEGVTDRKKVLISKKKRPHRSRGDLQIRF